MNNNEKAAAASILSGIVNGDHDPADIALLAQAYLTLVQAALDGALIQR